MKKLLIASTLAIAFSFPAPMIAAAADEKKQCAQGEKWDKRKKECVEASSY